MFFSSFGQCNKFDPFIIIFFLFVLHKTERPDNGFILFLYFHSFIFTKCLLYYTTKSDDG